MIGQDPLWYAWVSVESGNNSVVECDLAKVEVAGSNPVSRSNLRSSIQAKVVPCSSQSERRGNGRRETPDRTFLIGAVAKW